MQKPTQICTDLKFQDSPDLDSPQIWGVLNFEQSTSAIFRRLNLVGFSQGPGELGPILDSVQFCVEFRWAERSAGSALKTLYVFRRANIVRKTYEGDDICFQRVRKFPPPLTHWSLSKSIFGIAQSEVIFDRAHKGDEIWSPFWGTPEFSGDWQGW